jgi:hypothetical protein
VSTRPRRDFADGALVLGWLDELSRRHPEQRPFVDDVASQVRTRSAQTLHYGALGLRFKVEASVEAGDCSQAFQRRADAVLWALEVLAAEDARYGLPRDVLLSIATLALTAPDDDLEHVPAAIEIAERLRWHEEDEARDLLAAWPSGSPAAWREIADRMRRAVANA